MIINPTNYSFEHSVVSFMKSTNHSVLSLSIIVLCQSIAIIILFVLLISLSLKTNQPNKEINQGKSEITTPIKTIAIASVARRISQRE